MTKNWTTIRRERVKDRPDAENNIRRERRLLELDLQLGELRRARGLSQVAVGGVLGMSQENVSRIERQGDITLSTLERYVEGLGGKLAIAAVFDGERIELAGDTPVKA